MKSRNIVFWTVMLIVINIAMAKPVDFSLCRKAAQNKLSRLGKDDYQLRTQHRIEADNSTLAWIFELDPQGYIAVSGDDILTPVIAYSFTSEFFDSSSGDILQEFLSADLSCRRHFLEENQSISTLNQSAWEDLLMGDRHLMRPEQWPPEGSTPTGGWLPENWSQNSPYNDFCPLDTVTGGRSLAGCPAVAMAQILNYHRSTNGVSFADDDDYYHNYAGRQYWIDDDYQLAQFLSFPQMNTWLDTLSYHYLYDFPVSSSEKAALVFACGVAAQQVYTSQASGTFGVDQAFAAFQKFNFSQAQLLDESATDIYEQIAQNMMDGLPVHFASVTPAWDAGHNFVVDGYNTDGFFHLNMGWGGTYNGWYSLPDNIPYGLTVLEGAIVNIIPQEAPAGFISAEISLTPVPQQADTISISIESLSFQLQVDLLPDENGFADFIEQTPVGNYTVTASYPDYEMITLSPVTVNEFDVTDITFSLSCLLAPYSLTAELCEDSIELQWQHDSSRQFQYFNIYRSINSTAYTLLDSTSNTNFSDEELFPQSALYSYKVTAVYEQNNESLPSNEVFVENIVPAFPDEVTAGNKLNIFPNPFNPEITISFSSEEVTESAEINIYSIKGQLIRSFIIDAGRSNVVWDGRNEAGKPVGSGIYFIRLEKENSLAASKKCLLLK